MNINKFHVTSTLRYYLRKKNLYSSCSDVFISFFSNPSYHYVEILRFFFKSFFIATSLSCNINSIENHDSEISQKFVQNFQNSLFLI